MKDSGSFHNSLDDEALGWAVRMADPSAEWEAFTAWLEADTSNAARYDRAVCVMDEATAMVRRQEARPSTVELGAPESAPPPTVHRRWLGGAIAAALAGVIGYGVWHERDRSYVVDTSAGQQRSVQLADGSSMALAGGSQVRLDPARPRSATVLAGQVLFRVRHDAADPFRVHAGDLDLADIGTVFDVRLLGTRTQVAVAEGAVMVAPDGARLRLGPGQSVTEQGGQIRRGRQEATTVGSWQKGHLTYDDATLRDVAEDLSRQLGIRITAAPAVAARPFNGTLEMRGLRDDPDALGALLDVEVRSRGEGWILDARR